MLSQLAAIPGAIQLFAEFVRSRLTRNLCGSLAAASTENLSQYGVGWRSEDEERSELTAGKPLFSTLGWFADPHSACRGFHV